VIAAVLSKPTGGRRAPRENRDVLARRAAGLARALLAAMLLGGWLASAAVASPTPEGTADYYEDALNRFDKGDYRGAIIQLKNALQKNPDDLSARLLLGRAYLQVGAGAAAEKEIRRARAGGAADELVLIPLAEAYLLQGKYRQFLDEIRTIGANAELEAKLMEMRGEAYLELRELDNAEKAFAAASDLKPGSIPARLGQARVRLGRGQFDEAQAIAREVLKAHPDETDAWYLVGEAARLKRDFAAAVEAFDRVIETLPNHLPARLGRAAVLIELGRLDDALADIERVRGITPRDPGAAFLNALVLMRKNDPKGAREILREAAIALSDRDPDFIMNHAPSLLIYGVINFAQRRFDDAALYLNRFIEINPYHPGARKLLGAILIQKGDDLRALEILEPARRLAPNDAQLYALLGTANMRLKNFEKAAALFDKASRLAPDRAAFQTQLALSRLALGENEAAIKTLESASALESQGLAAGILLGLVHLRAKRDADALRVFTALVKREPENPILHNLMGVALMSQGDAAEARESFERALAAAPKYLPARYNLATLDAREGHRDQARARLQEILRDNPNETRAMLALSRLAEAEGRIDDAILLAKRALGRKKLAVSEQIRLVHLYTQRKSYQEAILLAKEIENQAPNDIAILEVLGRAQLAAGKTEAAAATFGRIASRLAGDAEGLYRVSKLQRAARDIDGARASLRQALELAPESLAYQEAMARLELGAGDAKTAFALVEKIRRKHRDSAVGDRLYGDLMMQAKRYREAVKAYRAALEKEPRAAHIIRLYRARKAADPKDIAIPLLVDWLSRHPDDADVRRLLAAANIDAGLYDVAIAQYERLRAAFPDDPAIVNNLAWLYYKTGDSRALSFAEKAYAMAPSQPATLDTLGWLLVESGDPARGLRYLRDAFARAPREPEVRYHLAVALARLGRTEEARRELESALGQGRPFNGADDARALLRRLSAAE